MWAQLNCSAYLDLILYYFCRKIEFLITINGCINGCPHKSIL